MKVGKGLMWNSCENRRGEKHTLLRGRLWFSVRLEWKFVYL